MMKKRRHRGRGAIAPWMLWTITVLISSAIVAGIFLWPEDAPPASVEAPDAPSLEVRGVQTFRVREGGQTIWELSAEQISVSADRVTVTAEGVKRGTYYREGKPFLHWQAQRLRLNQTTRDIVADGQVSANGPDGFSLRATRADWSHQKQELRCNVPVKATLRGAVFEAPSLVYDATTGQLHCPQNARAVTKDIDVQAGSVTYDTRSGLLRCARVERAVAKGITVEAGSVTYDTRSGSLRCARVERAVANGFTVSGQNVVFETKSGMLRGNELRVETSSATLRGGSAVVDTRARNVRLSGGIEIRVRPGAAQNLNLPQLPVGGP